MLNLSDKKPFAFVSLYGRKLMVMLISNCCMSQDSTVRDWLIGVCVQVVNGLMECQNSSAQCFWGGGVVLDGPLY